jgi:inorganic pyrophosphatase
VSPLSRRPAAAAAVLAAFLAPPVEAQRPWPHAEVPGHPYDEAQPATAPQELWVVIEIPEGSAIKYEVDKATGRVYVDRFQSMPVHAPANYGSIPSSLAADGDPLDAIVIARAPLHPGVFIKVRPIGIMKTQDGAIVDDKILVVPVSAVDPTYDGITELSALPRWSGTASRRTSACTSSSREGRRAACWPRTEPPPRAPPSWRR